MRTIQTPDHFELTSILATGGDTDNVGAAFGSGTPSIHALHIRIRPLGMRVECYGALCVEGVSRALHRATCLGAGRQLEEQAQGSLIAGTY